MLQSNYGKWYVICCSQITGSGMSIDCIGGHLPIGAVSSRLEKATEVMHT